MPLGSSSSSRCILLFLAWHTALATAASSDSHSALAVAIGDAIPACKQPVLRGRNVRRHHQPARTPLPWTRYRGSQLRHQEARQRRRVVRRAVRAAAQQNVARGTAGGTVLPSQHLCGPLLDSRPWRLFQGKGWNLRVGACLWRSTHGGILNHKRARVKAKSRLTPLQFPLKQQDRNS